jgi:MFS family permease
LPPLEFGRLFPKFCWGGRAIAIAIGLPLITLIVPQIGWRATYGLIGMLAMFGFLALIIGLPNGVKGVPVNFATWRAVSRNIQLDLLLLITMFLAAGQLVLVAFVGPLLSEATGATPRDIAFVFMLFGVMTLVGNVTASQLVKSWSAFRTSAVFMICVLAGVSLWIFARATLTMFAAQSITERARLNRKYPAGSHPNQQNQALITILRLIDGSDEVNDEKILQTLLRSIKTLAEKGFGRKPT